MDLIILTHGENPLEQFRANCQRGVLTTIKEIPFLKIALRTLIENGLCLESTVWANPETLEMLSDSSFDFCAVRIISAEKEQDLSDVGMAVDEIFNQPQD